jgi:hypothetical protein
MAKRSSSPPISALLGPTMPFREKADFLVWKVTYDYLMTNMDENAKLELDWYRENCSSESFDRFVYNFFEKFGNPYRGKLLNWTCINVSACAVSMMKEIFEQ